MLSVNTCHHDLDPFSCSHTSGAGAVKKEPIVVGKPAEFMLQNIAEQFKLERHQICMVGDRLDTDILFGQQGGLTTMLVLSGTSSLHLRFQDVWQDFTQLHI